MLRKKRLFVKLKKKIASIFSNTKCPKFVGGISNQVEFKCRGKFSFKPLKEKIGSIKNQYDPSKSLE